MGTLILPPSGPVYVDANSAIYTAEKIEPYCTFLSPLWPAAQAGQVSIVTSELTSLEALVKPMRDGNTTLKMLFRAFLTAQEVELIPATLSVGRGGTPAWLGFKDAGCASCGNWTCGWVCAFSDERCCISARSRPSGHDFECNDQLVDL